MESIRIEGVPAGCKLVRIGVGRKGEHYLDVSGEVFVSDGTHLWIYPILTPDNCYGTLDLTTVPVPEGYERDGDKPEEWFREYVIGETVINSAGRAVVPHSYISQSDSRRIILRRIAAKTKRVLVEEIEIADSKDHIAGSCWPTYADRMVSLWPGRFRIEEREI